MSVVCVQLGPRKLSVIRSSGVSAIQGLLKYWSEWEDSWNFQNCQLYPLLRVSVKWGSTVLYYPQYDGTDNVLWSVSCSTVSFSPISSHPRSTPTSRVSAVVTPTSHEVSPLLPRTPRISLRTFGSYYTLGNMSGALIFIWLLSIPVWLFLVLVVLFVLLYCVFSYHGNRTVHKIKWSLYITWIFIVVLHIRKVILINVSGSYIHLFTTEALVPRPFIRLLVFQREKWYGNTQGINNLVHKLNIHTNKKTSHDANYWWHHWSTPTMHVVFFEFWCTHTCHSL